MKIFDKQKCIAIPGQSASVWGSGLLLLLLMLWSNFSVAQCSLTCNDLIQVSLDPSCQAEIQPDDVLEGYLNNPACQGQYEVQVYLNGNLIPTSPFVNADHIGMTLEVRAIYLPLVIIAGLMQLYRTSLFLT